MIKDLIYECEKAFMDSDYERTVEICNEILKEDLNNPTALGYKARSLSLMNECEKALTLLDNAMTLYPENRHYPHIKAEVLMENEDFDGAIECYEAIFEMGVADETGLAFIKMDYEICHSLKMDYLIERERYVDAWECYMRLLEIKSNKLERSQAIKRFTKYVSEYTPKDKKRHYYVKISSDEAKLKLIEFLSENGFKSDDESGFLYLIDVIDKEYNAVSVDCVGHELIISESMFLDKVNYRPRNKIVRQKIHDEDGKLVYDGSTLDNAPYGFGTAYFADGRIFREGIFDIKGIVQGREYYPSGQLRFEGKWSLTRGYGPNAPYDGDAYSEDGHLIYSGRFEIRRSGVGWPRILKPKGFPLEQKDRPKIKYY